MLCHLPRATVTAVLGLTTLVLLSGCNTTARRIAHNQAYFDSRPATVQEQIREGDIDIGFSKRDVFLALGQPDAKYTRKTADGENEVWAYWRHYPTYYHHSPYYRGYYGGYYGSRHDRRRRHDAWYWHDHRLAGGEVQERLRVVFDNGQVSTIERRDSTY